MTGIGRGSGGPPWSVDLLADLQAGALDPAQAAELWPRVNADPEAKAVLAALEATQADLREFALTPAPPMPAHFAARLDAAIATESQARFQATPPQPAPAAASFTGEPRQAPAPVVNLADARKRRNRAMGIGVGFLAAAAAAVVAFVVIPGGGGENTSDVAVPPPGAALPQPGPLTFKSDDLGESQLAAARGKQDAGPFSNSASRGPCFQANGVSPTATVIGASQVTVDGKPGTMFVLSSGPGVFRLLAVGPDCGPGNPATLADRKDVK